MKNYVLVVHDFDDPRLSPIFVFDSLENAQGYAFATFGGNIRFNTFKNTPDETAVSTEHGLIATIYEREVLRA